MFCPSAMLVSPNWHCALQHWNGVINKTVKGPGYIPVAGSVAEGYCPRYLLDGFQVCGFAGTWRSSKPVQMLKQQHSQGESMEQHLSWRWARLWSLPGLLKMDPGLPPEHVVLIILSVCCELFLPAVCCRPWLLANDGMCSWINESCSFLSIPPARPCHSPAWPAWSCRKHWTTWVRHNFLRSSLGRRTGA